MKFTKDKFKDISNLVGASFVALSIGVGAFLPVDDIHLNKVPHMILKPYQVAITYDNTQPNFAYTYYWRGEVNNDVFGGSQTTLWKNNQIDVSGKIIVFSNSTFDNGRIDFYVDVVRYSEPDYSGNIDFEIHEFSTSNFSKSLDFNSVNQWQINLELSLVQNFSYEFDYALLIPTSDDELPFGVGDLVSLTLDEEYFGFYYHSSFSISISIPRTYDDGFNDGVNYVLQHLDNYDLYTADEYIKYGNEQYQLGIDHNKEILSFSGFIREIFRAPITMFKDSFNFVLPLPDGTSLNVSGILTFFLTIGIALVIINIISKIGH